MALKMKTPEESENDTEKDSQETEGSSIQVFRYFIYLPHDYNKKIPKKKKNVGRDGEEA